MALTKAMGFLPLFCWSSDLAPNDELDNPHQLTTTFTDNSFPTQPRHLKRAGFGGEFQINTYTKLDQRTPSVATLSTGDFVVVWESNEQEGVGYSWGIYGQRFSNIGVPEGLEFQINTYTKTSQVSPSVAGLSTGDFVVVWVSDRQDGSGYGIYGQRFSNTGIPQGSEFQINTYTLLDQRSSSVAALTTGDFVVVWESDGQASPKGLSSVYYDIYGQHYSSTGVPQNGEFQINTYVANFQDSPSVAGLSTGDFVVVWESGGQDHYTTGIYGQRYSSTGTSQGKEFQINTYTTDWQTSPSVAGLSTGDFVVVWKSNGQDGDSWGIYGQLFSSTAIPQGSEFQVNTYTTKQQQNPSVAGLSTGDFVVVWTSEGQDGDLSGIYGQRYSSTGIAQGNEFQINTYTSSYQQSSSVAALNSGDFVVTWESREGSSDGSGFGIYGRIYFNDDIPPRLTNNALTINEGETIILSTLNINVSDADNSASELTFTVSNVQYGQFERISNPGAVITTFTQQDIIDRAIQFVHDGSENQPSYQMSVSDGSRIDGPASANVIFNNINDAPVLVNNALSINEGETVILSPLNLNATDNDNNASELTYTVSNVQYGQFEIVSNPGVSITTFTQQQVINGEVQFVHDGSDNQPSYQIRVSDSLLTDGPASANITFNNINDAPILVNNALTINEGETLILSPLDLNTLDPDHNTSELTYTVSNIQYGQFGTVNNPGIVITRFTQQQINDGEIQFIHNSNQLPGYSIVVTDGVTTPVSEIATIVLITQNQLVAKFGGTVVLSSKQLAIQTQLPPTELEIIVSNVEYGHFEKSINPGTAISSFTLSELNSGVIRFMHGGTEDIPHFTLNFRDAAADYTFSRAIAGNTVLNHPPDILNPTGTLNWPLNTLSNYSIPTTLFSDPDGDQLQLSVRELNDNLLPQWIQFDNATGILIGTPTVSGSYDFKIIASDPYDETVEDRFTIAISKPPISEKTNPLPIVAAIAGGLLGLGGCIGVGILYFKKAQDKKTRKQHHFAQLIRRHLKLQKIDNFKSKEGQRWVQTVQTLNNELLEGQGIDVANMDEDRLDELARNIATVAKNKISSTTVGLWKKSAITIQEFADNIDKIARDNQLFGHDDDVNIPMRTIDNAADNNFGTLIEEGVDAVRNIFSPKVELV